MTVRIFPWFLLATALAFSQERQIVPAGPEEPVYRVLFESGYYNEAIEFLTAKLADSTDVSLPLYYRYLAFSYAMAGDSSKAVDAFRAMLAMAPESSIDSIATPPRIMNAFHAAREPVGPLSTDLILSAPPVNPELSLKSTQQKQPEPEWIRVPFYLAPGGAGQFYNREYKKGTLLLCMQGVTLATSIWAYQERRNQFDPKYGWYSENLPTGQSYLRYSRINFSVFFGTYLYSVIDAFVRGRRP